MTNFQNETISWDNTAKIIGRISTPKSAASPNLSMGEFIRIRSTIVKETANLKYLYLLSHEKSTYYRYITDDFCKR